MTDAEGKLWYYLRARRLAGCKIRRQVPLGPYVADFLCEQWRIVIEVDGGQHADRIEHDRKRTAWLERRGYRVLRFWNTDVMANIEGVLEEIARALARPSPRPSPKGEGEFR
jgi:very-short-patch-repair endonuclease